MKKYTALICLIAVTGGIALVSPKPTHADNAQSHQGTFQQLDLFVDVLARVRNDYIKNVDNNELIEHAINGMLQSLDPHSSYISAKNFKKLREMTTGEYGGLGMEVTIRNGAVQVISPIDDTPAKKAGIEAGDYITAIDGKSIIGLSLNEAVEKMRGKPGSSINLTIIRTNEDPKDFVLVRENIKNNPIKFEVRESLAYVRVTQFTDKTAAAFKKAIRDLKSEFDGKIPGLIMDLRGNPGGLLDQSIKVSSLFLDGGEVVSTRGRQADDIQTYYAKQGEMLKNVPLVILIDGASASASEIVAGAMQDRARGLILGMQSFGKGSVQSIVPLRGGRDGALKLTTQHYYTPSGQSIQAVGITPDIAIARRPEQNQNQNQNRLQRREADLPHALINELNQAQDNTTQQPSTDIDYPPEDFDISTDYQLQQAINLLKDGSYKRRLAALK